MTILHRCLMAIIAFGVALDSVEATLTACRRVPLAPGSPAWPTSDPADLRLAHAAAEPVATPLLHEYHLAGGAEHGLAPADHLVQHLLGGAPVGLAATACLLLLVLLVFLAVLTFVDSLESYNYLLQPVVDLITHSPTCFSAFRT